MTATATTALARTTDKDAPAPSTHAAPATPSSPAAALSAAQPPVPPVAEPESRTSDEEELRINIGDTRLRLAHPIDAPYSKRLGMGSHNLHTGDLLSVPLYLAKRIKQAGFAKTDSFSGQLVL